MRGALRVGKRLYTYTQKRDVMRCDYFDACHWVRIFGEEGGEGVDGFKRSANPGLDTLAYRINLSRSDDTSLHLPAGRWHTERTSNSLWIAH